MSVRAWPPLPRSTNCRTIGSKTKKGKNMGEKKKSAWIDAENRIVSFHAIDSGKVIQETESLFWDFVRGLMSAGYRIM